MRESPKPAKPAETEDLRNSLFLASPAARAALKPCKSVYWHTLGPGRRLGYRCGTQRGSWIAKLRAEGQRQETRLGLADREGLAADGAKVLDWVQAQTAAWAWFAQCLGGGSGALAGSPARYTVAQAAADYVAYLRRNHRRSADFYELMLRRHVRGSLGKARLDQLTPKQIEQWRERVAGSPRRGARAPAISAEAQRQRRTSANLLLAILKAALNLARRDRSSTGVRADGSAWKAVAPFRGVRRSRLRFLASEEQRELVTACSPEGARLVRAALYTGARFSELANMRLLDFNPSAATLLVAESKSAKSRHLRLEPEAVRFFRSLVPGLRHTYVPEQTLLSNHGEPWTANAARAELRRAWRRIAAVRQRAGQAAPRPCTFHELRHTAASRWVAAGLPMKFVAAQLGHSTTAMTEQYYVHLAPADVGAAFARLPALQLGRSAP